MHKCVFNETAIRHDRGEIRRRTNGFTCFPRHGVLDAGIRTPRGFFEGNFVDLGNYFPCLNIEQALPTSVVGGKYCRIRIPLNQQLELPTLPTLPDFPDFEWPDLPWPELPWPELNPNTSRIPRSTLDQLSRFSQMQQGLDATFHTGRSLSSIAISVAVCLPKACTTREAIDGLMFNSTAIGLQYEDMYCRLPNDKPWAAADYVAIALFSLIGLITILSTSYDVRHTVVLKTDPKRISKLFQAFSLYTNTRRLFTYTPATGTIECLDGIRVFAILWVIVGHTFLLHVNSTLTNPLDGIKWFTSLGGLWINNAPMSVDSFFMISGLLVVYTTVGKLTRRKLFQNLHLYYLNRLLRMFPILATFVLIQATFLHWVSDGPMWNRVVFETHNCRVFWWTTLLYIQNYASPDRMCLPHSWYLAIDIQLHILSPLVLFWILGTRRRVAWVALTITTVASITAATVYNTIKQFPSTPIAPHGDYTTFSNLYYFNTLTRCSPFFIGMMYGYLLHLCRGKIVVIPKTSVAILWLCAFTLSTTVFGVTYPLFDVTWRNQTVDTLYNSLARPAWAVALGWLVFACHHGYGGPINWFLCLRIWKVPSRISYAMYITHFTIMIMFVSTVVVPFYFTAQSVMFNFYRDLVITLVVSFILTLFVDSPFSTLIKIFLGGGQRRTEKPVVVDGPKNLPSTVAYNQAYVDTESKIVAKL
ncbi:hypothetical protein O3G_MSEX006874 [Manduca sexta]|uniref:Acyltransferase 3 domain-containing protein n=1 Tax=Manduca sexta TaxID=7130 RepID=A0A922CM57_MANSE|nr:hypothetical protein O3G_MSEX006874 [Manduca sexta]